MSGASRPRGRHDSTPSARSLAALQAYREQRYADFARLAGSHWIRQSSTPAGGRLARTNDAPAEGERAHQTLDHAPASALPPEPTLR